MKRHHDFLEKGPADQLRAAAKQECPRMLHLGGVVDDRRSSARKERKYEDVLKNYEESSHRILQGDAHDKASEFLNMKLQTLNFGINSSISLRLKRKAAASIIGR